MKPKEFDFIYHDDVLYRLKYNTSKVQHPSMLICAVALKLGDSDKNAILLRKNDEGVTYYEQPNIYDTAPKDEVTIDLIQLEHERAVQIVKRIELKHIQQLPVIWIVELYNGCNMVIPEAQIRRFAL